MSDQTQYNPLPGSKANKPFDIFGFVSRYGLIIVIFGLFLLTMFVPVVLKMKKPNYETHAMLKIDPVISSLITKSEDPSIANYYHDFVRTQAARISEYEVMASTIESLTDRDREALFPAHLSTEECVPILQAIIQITPVGGTHLVKLSIQGPRKEGLAPVLNTLISTYLEKMQNELEQNDIRRLTYLNEKKRELQKDIERKENHLQDIASSVLSSTFSESFNIWQMRMVELQKTYIGFFGDRVRAENEWVYQQKVGDAIRQLPLESLVDEGVMDDNAIGFTSSWTYQQLQDMRSSIDGVTAENHDRKRVEQRMQAMREYEKTLRKETRESIHSIVYGKKDLELKESLIKKENAFKEAKASEEEVFAALKEAEAMSGRNSSALLKGTSFETELEHDRNLLFRIDTRIHELEAESRAPLRTTVESMAKEPRSPAGSNIKKLLMACVVVSFGSVGGVFILIEFFDNRIHSPKNIMHALGHPPTWPITQAPQGVDFHSVLSEASDSVTSKALRSLATRLFRAGGERGAKVFLFTAVDRSSGTTSITMNCAQSLAHQSSRVLVIDANLQDWEAPDGVGVEIDDPKLPMNAIQHDDLRGIDYLVSFMPRRSDRYTSRMLAGFLREAREQYDFICIDAPPVLTSDLTEYLATNSDVGVLIIRGDSTLYRDVRRSAEILVRLDIPALAPVLNWGGTKTRTQVDSVLDRASALFHRLACSVLPKVGKKATDLPG
jgi:succinoglycan biosynthesis transport protein ExoP